MVGADVSRSLSTRRASTAPARGLYAAAHTVHGCQTDSCVGAAQTRLRSRSCRGPELSAPVMRPCVVSRGPLGVSRPTRRLAAAATRQRAAYARAVPTTAPQPIACGRAATAASAHRGGARWRRPRPTAMGLTRRERPLVVVAGFGRCLRSVRVTCANALPASRPTTSAHVHRPARHN